MDATLTSNSIMTIWKRAVMMELNYLRNILISGDQDIESSNDILAICNRIAYLESELNDAESI